MAELCCSKTLKQHLKVCANVYRTYSSKSGYSIPQWTLCKNKVLLMSPEAREVMQQKLRQDKAVYKHIFETDNDNNIQFKIKVPTQMKRLPSIAPEKVKRFRKILEEEEAMKMQEEMQKSFQSKWQYSDDVFKLDVTNVDDQTLKQLECKHNVKHLSPRFFGSKL